MVERDRLKDLLPSKDLSRTDKVLLCLGVDAKTPKAVKEIKAIANAAGLRAAAGWNVSALLARSDGRAVRTDRGWELNQAGKRYVSSIAGVAESEPHVVASSLRTHLAQIEDDDTRSFVEQAIECFEHKLYRAAVVLTWVGAVSLLYQHVVENELATFNTEASRRDARWKQARTTDDLARMKERDFLNILEAISVVGKSVKHELELCLRFRNGCGHPNSLRIGENRVASHIEVLTLNVFANF